MPRVFISYKRADKDKVFPLKEKIEAAIGEPCWIDLDGIESDAQFVKVIMQAIDDADIFLFMYSQEHGKISNYKTDWTIREVNYAQEEGKRVVFINIDQSPLIKWFKFMFPQQQQVDATSEDSLAKLLSDMQNWLKIPNNSYKPYSIGKKSPLSLNSQYIDLGLSSGIRWKTQSEVGLYTFNDALQHFGNKIPSPEMFRELIKECEWRLNEKGFRIIGPNGNSIFMSAQGYKTGNQISDEGIDKCGQYWSNRLVFSTHAYVLEFDSHGMSITEHFISHMRAVHLIEA